MRGLQKISDEPQTAFPPIKSELKVVPPLSIPSRVRSNTNAPSEFDNRAIQWNSPYFFFLMGCAFSILPIINALIHPNINKDYRLWYSVGRSVIAGNPLYEDVNGEPEFMYPPTAAVLLYAPLSCFSPFVFTLILCVTNAVAWAFAIWAARVLVAGEWSDPLSFVSLAPGLAIASYVWDVQLLGQLNLFLLALTLAAFVMVRNRHSLIAGGLFGLAVAIKVFPLPAIAYFVVRRQWKAVWASMISIVVFASVIPGLVRGFERNTAELKQWAQLMIGDQSGHKMAGRSSIGFTRRNQSLVSLSHRLLRHINAGDNRRRSKFVNFADVSPMIAQLIGYGACLLLGLILLMSTRFQFGRTEKAEGLELAMVCTLVPLCSPLAWTYYFCWLLPAWTAIAYWINNPRLVYQKRQMVIYGVVLSSVLLVSAISEQFDPTLQALGVTAFGSVTLFLTLAYIRYNLPEERRWIDEPEPFQDSTMEFASVRLHPKPK